MQSVSKRIQILASKIQGLPTWKSQVEAALDIDKALSSPPERIIKSLTPGSIESVRSDLAGKVRPPAKAARNDKPLHRSGEKNWPHVRPLGHAVKF